MDVAFFKQVIEVVLSLAVIGFFVYLITKYIPMPAIVQEIIYFVVAVLAILWLLTFIK